MASYNRHSNNLDKDLDSLSFSYLDGIPFRLDPRIEAVNNYDFTRVDTLVAQTLPTPGLSDMCENLIQKMGVLEKQVLQQLEASEMAKKAEEEKERQEEKELEEKRAAELLAQENAAKEAAAAEKARETEENGEEQNEKEEGSANNKESTPESETEPSTSASISESTNNQFQDNFRENDFTKNNPTMSRVPATLTAMPAMGSMSSTISSSSSQTVTKPPVNINFSEFERESDPFEKAELQTLNTMEQLAEVLQTTTASATTNVQPITIPNPPVYSTSNTHSNPYITNVAGSYPYYGAGNVPPPRHNQHPNQFYYQPPRPYFPPTFQTAQPEAAIPPPSYESVAGAQANVPTSTSINSNNEMKSSKSVGDIMAEIKKEAEAFEKMKIKGHRRKNSRTPPPISVGNPSKNVMDDWVPWPDLDGSSPGAGAKSSVTTIPSVNPALLDLDSKSQEICKQISEMGFALDRVAKGCKSFGDDRQKIINYCLMVDKLTNSPGEKFDVKEVEYVLPIHNLDEDLSRKHLRAFQKLEELGFDRMATHNALMNTKLDHDKALEILLK